AASSAWWSNHRQVLNRCIGSLLGIGNGGGRNRLTRDKQPASPIVVWRSRQSTAFGGSLAENRYRSPPAQPFRPCRALLRTRPAPVNSYGYSDRLDNLQSPA